MSDHFEARVLPAIRNATQAFVDTLLDEMLPALKTAAQGCGYALAVHGTRARDIDLLAVPWTTQVDSADLLVDRLCGAMAGFVGRAIRLKSDQWTEKPHGRRALTIILPGMCPEIDLSVMPTKKESDDEPDKP